MLQRAWSAGYERPAERAGENGWIYEQLSCGEAETNGKIAPQAGRTGHQKANSCAETAPERRPTREYLTEAEVERLRSGR
jgi:hypothetical protein